MSNDNDTAIQQKKSPVPASFTEATALEQVSDTLFRTTLSDAWAIWGPNGGYLASMALRAVSYEAGNELFKPASFSCQFFSVAKFAGVEIRVQCVKPGKVAKAYEVAIEQEGKIVLKSQIWLTKVVEGIEHDHTARPATWKALQDCFDWDLSQAPGFFQNFNLKATESAGAEQKAGRPETGSWYYFKNEVDTADAYVNAAKALTLIDTLQWPAAMKAHVGTQLSYIAPSLDLYIQFHNPDIYSPWLFCSSQSLLSTRGLLSGSAEVWDERGVLLASGSAQHICRNMAP